MKSTGPNERFPQIPVNSAQGIGAKRYVFLVAILHDEVK